MATKTTQAASAEAATEAVPGPVAGMKIAEAYARTVARASGTCQLRQDVEKVS